MSGEVLTGVGVVDEALVAAREQVGVLSETVKRELGNAAADTDVEVTLRDVRGAANSFINKTKPGKLGEKKPYSKGKDPTLKDGWVALRFRLTEEQKDVVVAALSRSRQLAPGIEASKKLWMNIHMERIAAEFIATHGTVVEDPEDDKSGALNADEQLAVVAQLTNRLLEQAKKIIAGQPREIGERFVAEITEGLRAFAA